MKSKKVVFDEIYRACYYTYAQPLLRFILVFIRDVFAAEEIVQDVFLKVYERREFLDPESPTIKSFLFTVAKNSVYDYLRRQKTERKGRMNLHMQEAVLNQDFYNDVENAYIDGEVISTIHDVLNDLPDNKREIFLMRIFLNKKIKDIAKEMDISQFVIKKIINEVMFDIKKRAGRLYEIKIRVD
jgi:RNA polymerase sigma factor (sigma-70 family)